MRFATMPFAPSRRAKYSARSWSALGIVALVGCGASASAPREAERPVEPRIKEVAPLASANAEAPPTPVVPPKPEAPPGCPSFASLSELCVAWGQASGLAKEWPTFDCNESTLETNPHFSVERLALRDPLSGTFLDMVVNRLLFQDLCDGEETDSQYCRASVTQLDQLVALEDADRLWPIGYSRLYEEINGPQLHGTDLVESIGAGDITIEHYETAVDGHHEAAPNNLQGSRWLTFLRPTARGPLVLAGAQIASTWHGYRRDEDCTPDPDGNDDCYVYIERDWTAKVRRVATDAFEIALPKRENVNWDGTLWTGEEQATERLELNGTDYLCADHVLKTPRNLR